MTGRDARCASGAKVSVRTGIGGHHGQGRRGRAPRRAAVTLLAALIGLSPVAGAVAALAQDAAPKPAEAAPTSPAGGADTLAPPPVIAPKSVEVQPVAPGAAKAFGGEEQTLSPVPVLTLAGTAKWDEAYDRLVETGKMLDAELARLGLKRAGDIFVLYSSSDDLGFEYEVQMPFSGTTTQKPSGEMRLGGSFAGKVFRFTHAGSFADMDNTYEQIANFLDERNIQTDDLYIERYRTDLLTAPADALEIDILVPIH